MSCDFNYVCVTPAHGMSPWTQRGQWLIPKGLFVIHRKLFGNLSIASFWRGDITIDEEVLLFIIERKVAEMGFRKHQHHVRTHCRISCLPFFHLLWNIWKYRNQIIGREKGVPSVLKFLSLPRWGSVSYAQGFESQLKKNIYEQDVSLETVAIGIILSITPVL